MLKLKQNQNQREAIEQLPQRGLKISLGTQKSTHVGALSQGVPNVQNKCTVCWTYQIAK